MLIVVLCTIALGQLALGQEPLVTVSQGTMKGKVLKSRDGRDYFSFSRIPYAKSPVGERRFMISEKADSWTGVLDATLPSPYCFQFNFGEEDCLYLNVVTPNITGKYPVIFSIHGGAFSAGSAEMFGSGTYFMDEDVVLVFPNYRIGALGFLSLENDLIPGNNGHKDQALALEWVHKEIGAFGGDPNLITVIGESAGAVSADIICSAPRTNGLIKACVSESGTGYAPLNPLLKPGFARKMALKLAKKIDCAENGELLQCLQSKPLNVIGNLTLLSEDAGVLSFLTPVLESENNPGALITSWPTKTNRNYPWIIGICQEEGLTFTLDYENHRESKEDTEKYIKGFDQIIISELNLENRTNDFQRIKERFFGKDVKPLVAIRNFISEYLFVHPAMKALSKHPGPTYFYKFNYTGGPQMPAGQDIGYLGVGHGAETPYFTDRPFNQTPDHSWPKPADIALSKMLVKMWVNFARDQTPSSQGMVQWSQFQGQYFLDIQNSGVTVGNYTKYQEILDFWKSINPELPSKSPTIHSSLLLISSTIFIICKALFL